MGIIGVRRQPKGISAFGVTSCSILLGNRLTYQA